MSRKQYSRYVLVVDNLSSSTPSSGRHRSWGQQVYQQQKQQQEQQQEHRCHACISLASAWFCSMPAVSMHYEHVQRLMHPSCSENMRLTPLPPPVGWPHGDHLRTAACCCCCCCCCVLPRLQTFSTSLRWLARCCMSAATTRRAAHWWSLTGTGAQPLLS
jgi:hypothetical protein